MGRLIWTDCESERLRALWDRGATRATLCETFAPRPWNKIVAHACRRLRLRLVPDGWCTVTAAARRAGYSREEFRALLCQWGVRTRPHPRPSHDRGDAVAYRWRLVSWRRVKARLREHLAGEELESCARAAARLELPKPTLYRWAIDDGLWPSRQAGAIVRFYSSTWDEIAGRRRGETAVDAGRRLRLHPTTLRGWMRAENERSSGSRRVERHAPEVWDRLATTRRRREGAIARRARAA